MTDIAEALPGNYKKVDTEKAIDLRLKGLSYAEIGRYFGASKQAVIQRISKLIPDKLDVIAYKNKRADILSGQQARILNCITDEDIKKAAFGTKVTAFGILYDKERLERGESTSNVAYAELSKNIQERERKIEELRVRLGMIEDTTGHHDLSKDSAI